MAFPTSKSNLQDNVDSIIAAHINNIETKIGINGSTDNDSLDYKLSGVTGADKAASLAGEETLTTKTIDDPIVTGDFSGDAFLDENDMASDSATKVASQQSIKAYVDAEVSGAQSVADAALPKAGGTMTGDIQLGETDIKLDAVLSGDATWSGITIAGIAGATLAVGDLCYLNANDSRWELVDANLSDGYDKQLGICVLAGGDGEATEMLIYGKVRSAVFPTFTVGSPLYMSETAGDVTHTQPSTASVAIRIVGFAITAEDFLFNPSNDYITHA